MQRIIKKHNVHQKLHKVQFLVKSFFYNKKIRFQEVLGIVTITLYLYNIERLRIQFMVDRWRIQTS